MIIFVWYDPNGIFKLIILAYEQHCLRPIRNNLEICELLETQRGTARVAMPRVQVSAFFYKGELRIRNDVRVQLSAACCFIHQVS